MANGPRALANHARYLAGIQLEGWQSAVAEATRPQWVTDASYAPGFQLHLRAAYGWLLLAGARLTQLPDQPPMSVEALPQMAPGLVMAAELLSCRELERSGWLAELLSPLPNRPQPQSQPGLLATTSRVPDVTRASFWCEEYDRLVASFDNAVDES